MTYGVGVQDLLVTVFAKYLQLLRLDFLEDC